VTQFLALGIVWRRLSLNLFGMGLLNERPGRSVYSTVRPSGWPGRLWCDDPASHIWALDEPWAVLGPHELFERAILSERSSFCAVVLREGNVKRSGRSRPAKPRARIDWREAVRPWTVTPETNTRRRGLGTSPMASPTTNFLAICVRLCRKRDMPELRPMRRLDPAATPRASDQARRGQARRGQPRRGQARLGQARRGQPRQGQPRQGQPRQGQPRRGQPRRGQPRRGQPRRGLRRQGHARRGRG
jgi:hypothetical protein